MGSERRIRERVEYVENARIKIGDNWQECECINISMSGVKLSAATPIAPDADYLFEINVILGEEKLKISTTCTFIRKEKVEGETAFVLTFKKIDSASSINLNNIIRYQAMNDLST
jgi:PilZ domain